MVEISASMSAMNAADVFKGILVWGPATNRIATATATAGAFVYPGDPEQVTPRGVGTCSETLCTFDRFGYSATAVFGPTCAGAR